MILSTEKNETTTNAIKVKGVYKEGYGFIAKKIMKDRSLNVISKAIYAYICSYTGKGHSAFPSQKLISADLGINKGTLVKYIKELKDNGYITVIQHKEKGKFAQNLYTINILPYMVLPCMATTDMETARYGQKDTNNNNINNNIKINNIIYTENQNEIIAEETEVKKEKMKDIPVEIQQILKKYRDLGLPDFKYPPENYIILRGYRELGIAKLYEALTLMAQSEFVKNNMSINAIFKIENLKKALNGNFKDKANRTKNTYENKKEFERPAYENTTGDFIKDLLNGANGGK